MNNREKSEQIARELLKWHLSQDQETLANEIFYILERFPVEDVVCGTCFRTPDHIYCSSCASCEWRGC